MGQPFLAMQYQQLQQQQLQQLQLGTRATHSPLCLQMALAATQKLTDNIRASLLDFFSEDALGLGQDSL
jgi:hypothetical protein